MIKRNLVGIILTFSVLASMVFLLGGSGCAVEEETPPQEVVYEWKLAQAGNDPDPRFLAAEAFVELADKKSDGRIKMTHYPGDIMGDYMVQEEMCGRGDLDLTISWGLSGGGIADRIKVGWFSYTWDDAKERIRPGGWIVPWYDEAWASLNMHVMSYLITGNSQLFASTEIYDPTIGNPELAKFVTRCPSFPYRIKWIELAGYKALTMPESEAPMAMKTGIIDIKSGSMPSESYSLYRDMIKMALFTREWPNVCGMAMNQDLWNTLPKDIQEILNDSSLEVAGEIAADIEEVQEVTYVKKLQDYGILVVELTPAQWSAWAKLTQEQAYPLLADNCGADFMKALEEHAAPLPLPDDILPTNLISHEEYESRFYENLVKAGKIK